MPGIRLPILIALLALFLPAGAFADASATKLTGTVGPGRTITLKKAGKKVTTLRAGAYSITVTDRSDEHDFHLFGPGLGKNGRTITGVDFRGKRTISVKLRKGTYRYLCEPHEDEMRGSFRVT